MMPAHPLRGRTALVTGGNRGIGRACVAALQALGAEVTFTARSATSLAEAARALPGATGVICDVTDRARLAGVMAPGFDILVNNAATIAPIGRIADLDLDAVAASLDTNLVAAFAAIRLALPLMLARGRGTIVNLSSGAARRPCEGWAAYCTAKAGLAMLTRVLHLEYAGRGIRTFGLAPGVVDTGMQGQIRASGINPVSQLDRATLSPPEEPARLIAWLCTPAADALAGRELDIRDPGLRALAGMDRPQAARPAFRR